VDTEPDPAPGDQRDDAPGDTHRRPPQGAAAGVEGDDSGEEGPGGDGGQDVAAGEGEPGAGDQTGAVGAGAFDDLLEQPLDRRAGGDGGDDDPSQAGGAARGCQRERCPERVDDGPGAETGHGKGHVVDHGAAVVDCGSGERGVPEQEATAVDHGQRSEHQGHEHGEEDQQWPALAHGPERERRPGRRHRGSVDRNCRGDR
jgi:hypothetical protein